MLKLPRRRTCLDRIKPYVPGKPVEEVKRELGLDDVIKLASNENPLGPSPMALEALKEALPALNYYPDGSCFLLKEALASRLDLQGDQLIFGNGSDEVLKLLAEAYLEPGDEVIVPTPSFSEYEFVTRIMGGEVKYAPLKPDFSYDLETMLDMVTNLTRLIFVCSPNNPTGTIVTGKDLDDFMRRLPQGVIVVIDEAYAEYVTTPEYPQSLKYVRQGAPVIVLRTFSKIHGLAGLRIGYGAAPAELIADLDRVCEPFNVNQAAQVAALAALDDEEHLRRSIALVEEGRVRMARGLQDIGLQPVPSQANFYFVDTGFDARQVFDRLLRRGVIVRSGDIFGFPTFIRVNFGLPEENVRFLKALEEVLGELKGNS
ncbi:MAG: histidinol-phosphate transaminase [Firmicutes bacterium]|nr:histidinol-phosphate transaminase [Bacillota bacterium]